MAVWTASFVNERNLEALVIILREKVDQESVAEISITFFFSDIIDWLIDCFKSSKP